MKIPQARLEELSESWFESNREEFAERLAAGEKLVAFGKTLLEFEDIENVMFNEREQEIRGAMQLCSQSPELGGKHVKRIQEAVAEELVKAFQDQLRASYEHEINQSDAA